VGAVILDLPAGKIIGLIVGLPEVVDATYQPRSLEVKSEK